MKYFEVVTKCGHVGRDFYYEGRFYIMATNGKEAAKIARKIPRVKHDHKDAILSVTKINEKEYCDGKLKSEHNPYFKCKNKQEQKKFIETIALNIFEDQHNKEPKEWTNKVDRKSKFEKLMRLERKEKKYQYTYKFQYQDFIYM
jgi:hypothetical protein